MSVTLLELYERLLDHYGPQQWWPGESPFEVLVGAVLTQNTSWKNVARAIENLREADLLNPAAMYEVDAEELAELIRPAGYYRLKAGRLRNLLRLIAERYEGSLELMFATDLETLREELLSVNGVGPETADSILLYAGQLPSFVVDTYTHRVLARHGWIEFGWDYHTLQAHIQSSVPADVAVYNEFHALLVRVGNSHCRKTAKCEGCPLAPLLPETGPLSPDFHSN